MNHIQILKRAFNITKNYRALWFFGLLLALTTASGSSSSGGGSTSSSTNINPNFDWQHPFSNFPQISPEVSSLLVGVAISLGCLLLVLIVVGTFAHYMSETALIRMVDEHETSAQKLTIRQGFRLGWSRPAWKMFLMDWLVGLSFVFGFLLLLAVAALPLLVWLTNSTPLHVFGSIISGGLILLLVLAAIAAGLAATLILIFAHRACVLENLGVRASIRRGYQIVRSRLKDVILMGVMLFGIGLGWLIVSFIAILVVILAAALMAGLPALLVGFIVGLFTSGAAPWIAAGIIGIPIFLAVVIVSGGLIGGWQQVFTSSAWTLTYREALVLKQVKTNVELPAADSAPTAND